MLKRVIKESLLNRTMAIELEQKDAIAVIRFVRPQERNPLSIAVLDELHCLIDSLNFNDKIKTIIFTGSEDVFAAGANLREIAGITGATAKEYALHGQTLMQKIAASEKLTIAAVNGFCFGGAFDLALACKHRIAAPNAEFCHPGANLGIMTGWGGTQRLPRLIGEAKALEIFLTAKRVAANEALQIGLIDEIAEDDLISHLTRNVVLSCRQK